MITNVGSNMYTQNAFRSNSRAKNSSSISFASSREEFEGQSYSPEGWRALTGVQKPNKDIVLSKAMIQMFQSNGVGSPEKLEKMNSLIAGISDAVGVLREAEMIAANLSGSFDVSDFENEMMELASELNNGFFAGEGSEKMQKMINHANSLYDISKVPEDEMEGIKERAELKIAEAFKKAGILPQNGYVEVEHIGSTCLDNTFKVSFKDGKDREVFSDKVIKMGKDPKAKEIATKNMLQKSIEYYSKMTKEEFVANWKQKALKSIEASGMDVMFMDMILETVAPLMELKFEQLKSMSFEDHMKLNQVQMKSSESLFMAYAEAKNQTEQYYYDRKNNYIFAEAQ